MSSPRFVIRCDMEGVAGIVSYAQVEPGHREYEEGRAYFMEEILALVEGLKEGGAGEILIYDEHWFGRNLRLDRLPEGVVACCGKPPYREDWAGGLRAGDAGLILHGLHSKLGTGQVLHHTYEPDIKAITLNGIPVGEIGVEAAIAGDFGVPTVLMTGDSGGAEEARALIPGIATVEVKESQSPDGAACLPLAVAAARIREAARRAVKDASSVKPFKVSGPVTMEIDFNDGPYLKALRACADLAGPAHLVLEGDSVIQLWARYWKLKLKAQEVVRAGKV